MDRREHGRGRSPFSQIDRRPTLTEEALRRILDVLRSGDIAPGDRLPPERELADMLGISRPAVREALRALSLLGVITARPGRGTRVAESIDSLPMEPYLITLLLNRGRLLDLMEIRKILEPEVAAIAAQRATTDERAEIAAVYAEQARLVEEGDDVEAEADAGRRFHQALARATNNQTMVFLVNSLASLLQETGRVIVSRKRGASMNWHRAITEAVLRGDAAEARRVMRAHLDEVEHELHASMERMKSAPAE
jgi:GntR family transcriptional repressor for pyruvate dehydrogenase complex